MAASFTLSVLLTLREIPSSKGVTKLRVESWNGGKAKLAKRFTYDKDGEERCSKPEALDAEDLDIIGKRQEDIVKVMG